MSVREAMIEMMGSKPGHGEQTRWLERVVQNVPGLSFRTARSFWNRTISNEETHIAAQAIKQRAAIIKGQREAKALASTFESIADGLRAKDEDFYGADVSALISAARVLRNLDRT